MVRLYATLSALLLLALPVVGSAQVSNQKLAEVNRVAMEAYNNLDIETARSTLEDAIKNAERTGTHGAAMARTYANLGVIVVGGLGDSAAGVDAFAHALKEDPNVEPDPIVATPEIMVAFSTAKKKVGGRSSAGGASPRSSGRTEGNLSHEPAAEQLSQTAVPIFVGKAGLKAAKVKIFYRSLGMSRPKSADMKEGEDGWSYLIPCTDVFEPSVEYFIIAEDDDGEQVGNAGTPERPVAVPIVSTRSLEAPSLPGQSPPTQCGATGTIEECPPGLPGCSTGTAQLGDTCRSNSDCASGLRCDDDFCAISDGEESSSSYDKSAAPRWFLDVSFGMGGTIVGEGKTAAGKPSKALVDAALAAQTAAGGNPAVGDAFLTANGWDCSWQETMLDGQTAYLASKCKVAVKQKGLVPVLILNFALGAYVTPRFALALDGRIQLEQGSGALAGIAIGPRAEYLFTKPTAKGAFVGGILGVGIGTIQAQPPSKAPNTPYATSAAGGGVGAVLKVGLRAGYRFNRYIGLQVTPAVSMGLPRFLTSIDLVGGLSASF